MPGCSSCTSLTSRLRRLRVLCAGALLVLLCVAMAARAPQPPAEGSIGLESSIDVLLGQNQRSALMAELAGRRYMGRQYPWNQYVSWGRDLITTGIAQQPPVEPGKLAAPARPLADHYRCTHCHNLVREDVRLTRQDPEERERLIRLFSRRWANKPPEQIVALTSGSTLWGAVNRETFYNGHYRRYHRLPIADGSRMDPQRLRDAIQVCCRYCSSGRFPESWELDAMMAYLWELELRLKDLDLPESALRRLTGQLKNGDLEQINTARKELRTRYLRWSGAQVHNLPQRTTAEAAHYADGTVMTGDPKAGEFLYQNACARCHGTAIIAMEGVELVDEDQRFHRLVYRGTERDDLYMPLFTVERLSRRQTADIRAYLKSLASQE